MANITVTKAPMKVVAADTNENILVFSDSSLQEIMTRPITELIIKVTVGSIVFSVNKAIAGSADEVTSVVDDKLFISITEASKLRFKATTIGDTFLIYF